MEINNLNIKDKLIYFNKYIDLLIKSNEYISKRDYINILKKYKDLFDKLLILKDSNLIFEFSLKNNLDINLIYVFIDKYENIEKYIDEHNDKYIDMMLIKEKFYLDSILKNVDENVILDNDQRKVVLNDEDYTLVVAGAGAGKTTTVAAKVKYLVDRKHIKPEEILIISFTNKAVSELKDKINKKLSIPSPITTFHSTGNAILRKNNNKPLKIMDPGKIYYIISNYFKKRILNNEEQMKNLLLFFASYFDVPQDNQDIKQYFNSIINNDYSTIKGELNCYINSIIDARSKKLVTITNEVVRSKEEVIIANFLYLNGIEYEYEPMYKYNILFSRKPYTPDFLIKQGNKYCYIEHFGISEDGKNSRYTDNELDKYKKSIRDKIMIHKNHGTDLIYTFSKYNNKKSIIEHLSYELRKRGFILNNRSNTEIVSEIVSNDDNKYFKRLILLICRFINNFKTNDYDIKDFDKMLNKTSNVRAKLFLKICRECYIEYQEYLYNNDYIDFEDMINNCSKLLLEVKEMKHLLNFKYIFIDEYQDISKQRFNLTKALSDVCNAKIIAVGDDWQSIYAFSGSDISLFTKFNNIMGYSKILKIVNTYRNSQEIIDIAGNFIQKNNSQIKKRLISPKTIKDPVIIYSYNDYVSKKGQDFTNSYKEMGHAIEKVLEHIICSNKKNGNNPYDGKILVLGRYNFDAYQLQNTKLFSYIKYQNRIKSLKYPEFNMTYMTVHSSKGLGYDNVIIINCKNDVFGFPSKIDDDPVLKFVIKDDNSYIFAEERRLFYVAMTRTKNRVYFVAPKHKPSVFLLELMNDYKNILINGNFDISVKDENKKYCPICGYPLKYKYKSAYGLKLYICSNDPEICGFMTNDINGDKMSIIKCNKCRDGYLIIRNKNDSFLGCTNYRKDGLGCNNTISKKEYYERFIFGDKIYYDN